MSHISRMMSALSSVSTCISISIEAETDVSQLSKL